MGSDGECDRVELGKRGSNFQATKGCRFDDGVVVVLYLEAGGGKGGAERIGQPKWAVVTEYVGARRWFPLVLMKDCPELRRWW
jgi:hypothetical protein